MLCTAQEVLSCLVDEFQHEVEKVTQLIRTQNTLTGKSTTSSTYSARLSVLSIRESGTREAERICEEESLVLSREIPLVSEFLDKAFVPIPRRDSNA